LIGLGSATYERAINATQEIYSRFDREFEEGSLDEWIVTKPSDALGSEFTASNRYFTPRRDAPNMEAVPFGDGVDPGGLLMATVQGGNLVHGEENKVYYYSGCEYGENGEQRCVER